jgi:LDH2 family malate/lactate/ureidoglycolate dehydrogenase
MLLRYQVSLRNLVSDEVSMTDEIRIPYEKLVTVISDALAAVGVPSPVRDIEAQVTAEADLLGVPSHGIRMLPILVRGIREGRATANPQIKILRERAATCLIDGDNGPGRYVSVHAMNLAVDRAKQFGVGVCVATRVTHWGRAHAYAYRAAQAGCIGICTTNAIPNMLGFDSTRPILGNNPLAIGVPRAGRDPIVLDMAMSQAALGKVGTYLREGKAVPANWGLDSDGNSTDDPSKILSSGRVLPFGDHKGAGLAMMMELLTGALAGGLLSQEIARSEKAGLDPNASKFFLALDVEAFVDKERFAQRADDFLNALREMEPGLTITFPGERGWQTRDANLRDGIPIHREIVEQLRGIGIQLSH